MRDTWFGDDRDLVKWGTLAHITQREELSLIVQVPYFRVGSRPLLQTSGLSTPIHTSVWTFFRDLSSVERLGPLLGRHIMVVNDQFDPAERKEYRRRVVDRLSALNQRRVVLLDPDTGMAPTNARGKHSTVEDIQAIWKVLNEGDWLVLYQHASRTTNWREEAQQKLTTICKVPDVEVFVGPEIAFDVAFLAAQKSEQLPEPLEAQCHSVCSKP